MPWHIVNSKSNCGKYTLPNCEYTVGRLEGDFIVNDKSVSRIHAKIKSVSDMLCVEDLSKFGTFINKISLVNKRGSIRDGDIITFGAQPGVDFRCSFIQFKLIMSTLSSTDQVLLNDYMTGIDGTLFNDWTDGIRFLVMTNLKITYKVICALIKQTPIVTISFFKETRDYFLGLNEEPIADNFLPPTTDPNIVNKNISFSPDIRRRSLFAAKTFYFMTAKKIPHLKLPITSAGGAIVLITEASINNPSMVTTLSSVDSIVMYESTENRLVTQVYNILRTVHKRPILDNEIGFAVLYVTTNEYCNPSMMCPGGISSETYFSQNLDNRQGTLKRPYNEKENSEPKREDIYKKRRLTTTKDTVQSNQVSRDTYSKEEEDDEVQIIENKVTKECIKPQKNDNNRSISVMSETSQQIPSSIVEDDNMNEVFDDIFDDIEVPTFCPTSNKAKQDGSAVCEQYSCNTKSMVNKRAESETTEMKTVKTSEFSHHPLKLVPCTTVTRTLEACDTASITNYPSNCKLTKFERLVVVDMADVLPSVNCNYKTFKRVCPVYIDLNPIPMEVFDRKNY